jgi:two-component system nitrogen regulation response regulator GlnG
MLDQGGIDVAFIDINLGRESGFDILDSVRQRGIATDVVVITGKASVANAIEATRRGAYDYVTKPFDLDHLVALARRILDSRAAVHSLPATKPSSEPPAKAEIVGQSAAMQEVY